MLQDNEEDFIDEESETFIMNGTEHVHSEAWKKFMKHLHSLPSQEQDKLRAEIRAEAHREMERRKAIQN